MLLFVEKNKFIIMFVYVWYSFVRIFKKRENRKNRWGSRGRERFLLYIFICFLNLALCMWIIYFKRKFKRIIFVKCIWLFNRKYRIRYLILLLNVRIILKLFVYVYFFFLGFSLEVSIFYVVYEWLRDEWIIRMLSWIEWNWYWLRFFL